MIVFRCDLTAPSYRANRGRDTFTYEYIRYFGIKMKFTARRSNRDSGKDYSRSEGNGEPRHSSVEHRFQARSHPRSNLNRPPSGCGLPSQQQTASSRFALRCNPAQPRQVPDLSTAPARHKLCINSAHAWFATRLPTMKGPFRHESKLAEGKSAGIAQILRKIPKILGFIAASHRAQTGPKQ